MEGWTVWYIKSQENAAAAQRWVISLTFWGGQTEQGVCIENFWDQIQKYNKYNSKIKSKSSCKYLNSYFKTHFSS